MRGLMGSFAAMPLPDLVEVLGRRKSSGLLTCERGTVRKKVYLREGVAIGAASNDPREYLGQLLVNFGHIGSEQLEKAFRTQEETQIRFGKVLTMVGLVTPEIVRQTLAIKIRETLLDAFVWDSGLFYLDDTPPPPGDDLDVEVPLGEIAREAEFRSTAWQAFRATFPTGAATLSVDDSKVPAALAPGTVDGKLLALAREGKTIDEIGLMLHATDFHLYQRLYAMQRQGMLEAAPVLGAGEPVPSPMMAAELVAQARKHLAAGRLVEAESAAARAGALAPQLSAGQEILEQAERALERSLDAELTEPDRTPALRVRANQIRAMQLSSAEKYLLARCNGSRTVGQLAQLAPLRRLEVLKAIKKLVQAGALEVR
jgi:hypothetical protein